MTLRMLLAALALTTVLALAGCSSKDNGSGDATDTTTGDGSGNGGSGGNGGGAGGNATAGSEPYSCTAQPGNVLGAGGGNLVTVSGCNFVTLDGDAVYASETIPAGCESIFDENGDGQYDSGSPEVGKTYKSGTVLGMGCSATNQSGQGSITIKYA